jgi:multidrug resistance efflux pump
MKTFYAICITVILVLIVITLTIRSEATTFFGIADAQELVINDQFPVEIKKVYVVSGQKVGIGDTLVGVFRPELDFRIADISRQLNELRTQKTAHINLSRSEILQFKAQQLAKVNDLKAQIRELEVQLETNKKLVSELKSIDRGDSTQDVNSGIANPVTLKIQQLKAELAVAMDSAQTGMGRLTDELSYAGEPLAEKVRGLQDELNLLLVEKQRSFKTAQIDGVIGAVNYKEGEKLSPFTSILTLHPGSPSYVKGYIHENTYSLVTVGQQVTVSSLTEKSEKVAGEVVGVGSRIVEYPVRLRKNPDLQMWGREITIKIPQANNFLLGEKVLIEMLERQKKTTALDLLMGLLGSRVYAADSTCFKSTRQPPPVSRGTTVLECHFDGTPIEGSGAVYMSDLKRYLVVSDDTPDKKAIVECVDSSCRIEKEIPIEGLDRINDMESITQDEHGTIYIAASQSVSKKGRVSESRKLFIRVKRSGERLMLDGKVDLCGYLLAAANREPSKPWARFITSAINEQTCNIEGCAARADCVYFGFKKPLLDKKSVVLKIGPADGIFANAAVDISLWKTLDLTDKKTGAKTTIADLQFVGSDLYVLSNGHQDQKDRCDTYGIIWQCPDRSERVIEVWRGMGNPEGLAFNPDNRLFFVAYDNG